MTSGGSSGCDAGAPRAPRIAAYLELVRVHLTPTAAADSFAGYCIGVAARGRQPSPAEAAALAAASVLIYWTGMVLNDLFDVDRDRRRGVLRPIVRGAVPARAAAVLALVLGPLGVAAALTVSPGAALAAGAVLALAFLYDAGGKRIPVAGNLLMGSCRAGNFLIGALGALSFADLGGERGREARYGALLLGVYIAGVTAVSVLEDHPLRVRSFLALTLSVLPVPLLLGWIGFPDPWSLANALALLLLLLCAMARGVRASREQERLPVAAAAGQAAEAPHPAAGFVRSGLAGLFLVDAGLLLASGRPRPALAVYGLMILAWLWRRRWLQSPA